MTNAGRRPTRLKIVQRCSLLPITKKKKKFSLTPAEKSKATDHFSSRIENMYT